MADIGAHGADGRGAMLNIVITMAGRGARFRDAGYTVPKYRIMAHGRSLFDWSMLSLRQFLAQPARLVFVCLRDNDAAGYVRERCAALGLAEVHVIELDEVTDGQATSAWLARGAWLPEAPLLVYNIDTHVAPHALAPGDIRPGSDGWVPCFTVPGEHWSFVRLGEDGWAVDLAEKRRISDHASIGLYWFSRAADYADAYQRFFADPANLVRGERYIAPLYRQYLRDGRRVSISDIDPAAVRVLGTPAELAVFLQAEPPPP